MINEDLAHISDWSKLWKVNFSLAKTKSLIISTKKDKNMNPPIAFDGHIVEEVKSHTYLGVTFSSNLRWSEHINTVHNKA